MMLSSLIPAILSAVLSCVLAQNDCYSAAGERAGSSFIPCVSSSVISACCQLGDLCLSDSACWNPQYNVTYLYGCSDPTYTDPLCPWKCGPDYASVPYVGLVYCSNTTDNEWACTHPPPNVESIQPNPPQQCYNDSIVAFAGPSSLQPILSLPTNDGGSTVYFSRVNPTSYSLDPSYTPTTSMKLTASVPTTVEVVYATSSSGSATSNATTSSPSSNTNDTAISSSSPTPTSTAASGLSVGAKAGIGTGVGLGALALVAGFLAYFRHRSHKVLPETENDAAPVSETKTSHSRSMSELDGRRPEVCQNPATGYEIPSTASIHASPAPTYLTNERTPTLAQQIDDDGLHEME